MNSREPLNKPARALAAGALLWASLFWAGPAGAQSSAEEAAGDATEYPPVYRIEAIVFRHADGRSDRRRSIVPVDFTERLDPLLVATASDTAQRQLAALAQFLPVAEVSGKPDEATPFLESEEQTLRPIPPVYSALGDLSPSMQRAMSRLIDAPAYEPVTARAWIQLAPPRQHTPALRVHDRAVVETLEPAIHPSPAPALHVLPFGPLVEIPPPARAIYRLDGTVRLRQRQFMHLDLDLVWQMPSPAPVGSNPESGSKPQPDHEPDHEPKSARESGEAADDEWELHRLQQSRVVRPGRLEYFDSSLFGVLVRIERFEQVVPEIEETAVEETAPESEAEIPGTEANAIESGRPVTERGS